MHEVTNTKKTTIIFLFFPQPYRSTPLVLPGAKVYQNKNLPTESYLRHHPNPQMRANLSQEYAYVDNAMKQKVADSVLQRVVGPEEAHVNGPKVWDFFQSCFVFRFFLFLNVEFLLISGCQ